MAPAGNRPSRQRRLVDTLSEQSPCAVRLRDHTLRLWFAGRRTSNTDGADRIWSAEFTGDDDWATEA